MNKVRVWLAALLRRLAAWVDVQVEAVVDELLERAKALVEEQEARWPDRDGEAKRHQVYARLLKEFPGRPKRAISRAIEEVL